ncbi:MAG: hypothetical protein R3F17_05840 [Planctomycetota bacterium]
MKLSDWTRFLWLPLVLIAMLAPASAQRDKLPKTDPGNCPYCHNDPEILAKSKLVAHGGFQVARGTIEDAMKNLPGAEIYWLETEHFEIGYGLGPYKVRQDEKEKIRAECAELALVLENIPEKPKILDPWLRLHLTAMRLEKIYANMLDFFEVKQEWFPAAGTVWNQTGEYWGEGPYMGQKSKLEVMILPSEGLHQRWLRGNFGLLTKNTQRWHVIDTGALHLTIHEEQGSLSIDSAMHGHLAFNVSIMLCNSLRHYSYDMPIWLLEGIGHYMERQVCPKYNTFDSGEGGIAETNRKENWEPDVKKFVAKGEASSLGAMVRMTAWSELTLERHMTAWSMIDYLQKAHPGFLATLLKRTSDLRSEQNIPDGTNLLECHRDVFKEVLGMNYLQFDRAWAEWVTANYASK